MIEDPEFTRQILEYFASDDVDFPANKTVEDDLVKAFGGYPNISKIEYHVMCAYENELLIGDYQEVRSFEGVTYNFGFINGLTAKGGDYVRDSRSKYWNEAWEKIKETGLEVTTKRLLEFLPVLILKALS